MRRRLVPPAPLALALAAPLALTAGSAAAAPTCVSVPTAACGGRIVAEASQSTAFHQFDGPVESIQASLEAIEALAPRYLEVMTMAEATGDPKDQSFGGRPLWVVRVTDEQAPRSGKVQAAVSLSVQCTRARRP